MTIEVDLEELPDITNLVQLCELFGVSADYLVRDEETVSVRSDKSAKTIARLATLSVGFAKIASVLVTGFFVIFITVSAVLFLYTIVVMVLGIRNTYTKRIRSEQEASCIL